ncbi:Gfo/Idh/MocA family oxidoreductase [Alienimonas chondri]|uniref:Inositol 2-dehydrogenase/D-chiro-inositol 3-dehydrogenase n=1 Tax=Alienimonas chondri TaxID=2681879 RepID=A0ABX1VE57_9PLAN|nr:Gfo/Idh/MocA family oxidoreductase [Alienimonas chondri]NNJ25701.1 Inositol 2-dehydrogenase/D-chiro-inositol 3-dehydrogenase [Alienimonas chondri]
MTIPASTNRRTFLAASAAGVAATAFPARSYARIRGANDRLGVALIGAGGMGSGHLRSLAQLTEPDNLQPISVADCWKTRAEEGAKTLGGEKNLPVKAEVDYRAILDDDDVDYVTIASPEHQHAPMLTAALRAGKAAYCEKPLTHTAAEAAAVHAVQQETGLPVQVGVQGTSRDSYTAAADAIERGVLGLVVQAQISYVRRYGEQGPWRVPGLTSDKPKPDDLDWNAWLGDAPAIPWNPHHYFEWRCHSPYSGGVATDLFIHRLTRILVACGLKFPTRAVGMGGIFQWPDGRDMPDNFEMMLTYPEALGAPEGMTVYCLGTQSNRVEIPHQIRGYRGTLTFRGEGGVGGPTGWVVEDKDGKVLEEHVASGSEDITLHHSNLHEHLRDSSVALKCPIELGVYGITACSLANESWRTGQVLAYAPDSPKKFGPAAPAAIPDGPKS